MAAVALPGGDVHGHVPMTEADDTNADAVHCESLRISYKDPLQGERLTEDVFLDPRDSWCGDGGLLFVTANALTALQKGLDTQYNYFKGTQETIDKCRRDYMRELQYLLEELNIMKQDDPQSRHAIDELLQKVEEQRAEFAAGGSFDKDEVAALANQMGPREESDEALIFHLEKEGLSRKCELTLRMLLKHMHAGTDDLDRERARLTQILGPIEGEGKSEKVLDSLLAAAKGEGATICDVILAIQDHMRSEEDRDAIEDLVTDRLRARYAKLQDQHDELVPKLVMWRAQLAASEEREARLWYLNEEQKELTDAVTKREEIEKAKVEAWEAKNDPTKKAALVKMKAEDTSNLSQEDGSKLRNMMAQEDKCRKDCMEFQEMIAKSEEEIRTYHDRKAEWEDKLPDLERDFRWAEDDQKNAEEKLVKAEAREKVYAKEEMDAIAARDHLEDEYAAAIAPPPKNNDLLKLEEQVEQMKLRNAELLQAEHDIYEKERLYEERCASANKAWKDEEDAARRAEEHRKSEMVIAPVEAPVERQLLDDPMLLKYFERYQLPDVAAMPRFINMHTDKRARERQLENRQRERLAVTADQITRSAEAVGIGGPAWGAPKQQQPHIPVLFRRPEDLRVRLAGSEITAGHVQHIFSEHSELMDQLDNNLRGITTQIGSYGSQSFRLHHEARSALEGVQNGGSEADAASRDLMSSLQEHQVALENAEQAWHQAEQICERRLGESEVLTDERSCAVLERELTAATRCLYATASQAADDATGALAAPAQRCVVNLQAAEPQLAAAGAARSALWPRARDAAERLQWERQVQGGLESFLRDETTRRDLLEKEVKAPSGEAKRALASMRAAVTGATLPNHAVPRES